MNKRLLAMLAGSSIAALAAVAPAFAQDAPGPEDEADEIVVTGTQIRGVAPVGATVIGVSEAQIEATGAADTGAVLGSLPQSGGFFNTVAFGGGAQIGGNARSAMNRPNLRNLPGANTTTGSQTLLLVDGHRVVGTGIGQLAVDPELIAPGALARVETLTDGVSALYGGDAIGGVINFISRRNFDGIEVSGNYGFADEYSQWSGAITAGEDWNSGSAFIAYGYSDREALHGRDRDFVTQRDWSTNIPTGRNCEDPLITRSSTPGVTYSGADIANGAPNTAVAGPAVTCDYTDDLSIVPETQRHNVFAGFEQELTNTLSLDVRGFYAKRHDRNSFGGLRPGTASGDISVAIPATNYYRNLLFPGLGAETQNASFNYGSVLGDESMWAITETESWQVNPTLTWDLGESWQLRAMVGYGESATSYANRLANTTLQTAALAGSTADTAINPYNLAATQNLALITGIGSFIDRGDASDKFTNYRLSADGELMTLPGGPVRAAIGFEYLENDYSQRATNQTTRQLNPWTNFAQEVESVFGELSVPIVGEGNRVPGIETLTLSLSARHDSYNDFGETTNPRVGLTYEPIEWISLRGSWGTSFNAPTPPDGIGAATGPRIRIIPASVAYPTGPGVTPLPNPIPANYRALIMDQAPIPGLLPQEAETWSLGFNIRPPWIEGLSIDMSYYDIALTNMVNSPATSSIQALFNQYGTDFIDVTVTPGDVANTLSQNPTSGPALGTEITTNGYQIVSIVDNRNRNLGDANLAGIDFMIQYVRDVSFGSVDVSLSGNYQSRLEIISATGVVDELDTDDPLLRTALTFGADIGNLRAQASVNFSDGYDLTQSVNVFNQTEVDSYTVVNTYFRYDLEDLGIGSGTSLSLNINNVFDEDPPVLQSRDSFTFGYTNGFTVGRLIQVGFTQRF